MPPEASAGVPKGAYRKYVPEGIQVPLRARAHKSEQCAGFMCVSYKGKTLQAFFDSRLKRAISSSAEKSRASPITRSNASVTPCVLIRNRSRLSYLFIVSERMRYESLRTDKRKTLQAFFDSRLIRAISSSGRSRHIHVPLTYRIFAKQKYAIVLQRYDTASMPCIEGSSPRRNREPLLLI